MVPHKIISQSSHTRVNVSVVTQCLTITQCSHTMSNHNTVWSHKNQLFHHVVTQGLSLYQSITSNACIGSVCVCAQAPWCVWVCAIKWVYPYIFVSVWALTRWGAIHNLLLLLIYSMFTQGFVSCNTAQSDLTKTETTLYLPVDGGATVAGVGCLRGSLGVFSGE